MKTKALKTTRGVSEFVEVHGVHKLKRQQREIAALRETVELFTRTSKTVTVELPSSDNTLRFGAFGDTQLGSLYERVDCLHAFYQQAAARGIQLMLHTGDVLDGVNMYKGHIYELHKHGFEQQSQWFAEKAPRHPGIKTMFITGNHDRSLKNAAGVNVGKELQQLRPDWECIGEDSGRVALVTPNGRRFVVDLLHPGGGTAYAISYSAQKIANSLSGGDKPDLLAMGHFHKAELLPTYHNIVVIQTACFQDQTPGYMKPKGLDAHIGGWLFDVCVGDENTMCNCIKAEFVAFY